LKDRRDNGPTAKGRVLCVSSSGGHWQQLTALRPAWGGRDACYACTTPVNKEKLGISDFALIPDCNRNTVQKIFQSIPSYIRVFRQFKPDTIVSTGALPGLFFIVMGKLTGATTVWVESIANSEKLSLSGTMASYIADSFFVQAEHLADGKRRIYAGSVL
jgi:UDP-N-acetylglucosamine:LPS N-acetylglucosamine transferase